MKVLYIETDESTYMSILRDKLLEYGYVDNAMNNFFMCPFLVVRKDLEDYSKIIFENVNNGYLNAMKKSVFCEVEEVKDTKTFLERAKSLRVTEKQNVGLF